MSEKRRDNRNRILREGEYQRKDGRYRFRYLDEDGKEQNVYSWRLDKNDPMPKGKKREPSLREKEKQIEADLFDHIVTNGGKLTVLELVEKYIHGLFPIWGIRFVSIVDNADTDNKGNKKSRQINGLVNEWYLEDMSDNIRSVLTNRRVNGLHIGAFALYGYRKDPDRKGHLLIDEEAAAVVREVFNLFAQGYGKTSIARILNARGIPNPTEYKRQHGLRYKQAVSKNSTLWKYFAIADMLENEIYIGNMVQGKYGSVSYKTKQCKPRPKDQWYVVRGTHEPIIDQELWDKVCRRRAERSRPFSDGKIGIFARKARCAYCGYTLRSSKTQDRHYLQCPNRHISVEACPGAFIAVSHLEEAVLEELNRMAQEFLDKDEAAESVAFCKDLQKQKKCLQKEINTYRQKQEEYTTGIRNLYLDKVKGLLTEQDYLAMSKDFAGERDRLEHVIEDGEKQMRDSHENGDIFFQHREACNKYYQALPAVVEKYMNIEHLNREMVDTLIDYVTVGRRAKGTKTVPVEIHWNF